MLFFTLYAKCLIARVESFSGARLRTILRIIFFVITPKSITIARFHGPAGISMSLFKIPKIGTPVKILRTAMAMFAIQAGAVQFFWTRFASESRIANDVMKIISPPISTQDRAVIKKSTRFIGNVYLI